MKRTQENSRNRARAGRATQPRASSPTGDAGAGRARERVPKLIGSDFELGNFIVGRGRTDGTGREASRMLLGRIDGVCQSATQPSERSSAGDAYGSYRSGRSAYPAYGWNYASGVYYPAGSYAGDDGRYEHRDWGRKFLPTNGGCCYIDLDHLEVCTPEVLSARDFVAASRAMLGIARHAMQAANATLPAGERLAVLANNSDGLGNSFGTHLNFLISRDAWRRLFDRLYPDLFILAAFQASSVAITGQGKVGSENRMPAVDYQLSQRADFIETLIGVQTTFNRPLVNTRDEAHCGSSWISDGAASLEDRYARLHCIFFDHNLCQVASFLKVGTMQLLLSSLEAGLGDPKLMLEDPVAATHAWSHDPELTTRVPLANGRQVTAVELQRAFLESAKSAAARVGYEGHVADAPAILALWEETVARLEARDFAALRSRLDWVLKRDLIELTLRGQPDLDWWAPEIKRLDLMYGSLDEDEGLFWACERSGAVEQIVTHAEIEHFTRQPPDNTRAWTRSWLLRELAHGNVAEVDWDHVTFWASGCGEERHGRRTVRLHDPLAFTRADLDARLGRGSRSTARAADGGAKPDIGSDRTHHRGGEDERA